MAWDIKKDRDKIQDAINRIARRAKYYNKKGANTETENDFTYERTKFVNKDLTPVKLSELEAEFGANSKRLKEELSFLEEVSQRGYIGSIRRDFKENVLIMAEKMGYKETNPEYYKQLQKTSALAITRQYKMGELEAFNSYKRNKASAMVALLEKK